MNINLQNKIAFVCGSTQGIGKATAMTLAAAGAEIVLLARNEDKLKAVLAELPRNHQQNHQYIIADFSSPEKLRLALMEGIEKIGNAHILINNTGGPAAGLAIDAKNEDFVATFSQHLLCNQVLVQTLFPYMKKNNFGRIINVISTSVKQPIRNLGVSNTIRAAVANWAKTLSLELAPFGITVNNVLPGATKTERLATLIDNKSKKMESSKDAVEAEMLHEIPAGRFAEASEIAAGVCFLCSDFAAYINGINLPIDGGRTACL